MQGVTEGVTGGYWRVAGVTGRCCSLGCLCVSRNVPPGIPRTLNSPCVTMVHPVPPSCVSLRCPQRCSYVPYWCTCMPGNVPSGVPGCLSSPSVSPWTSHKMSLSPCIPSWMFPVLRVCPLCDPRVSPHPPCRFFPLDIPTAVPMSFTGAWAFPWLSLHPHAMCLCALAVPPWVVPVFLHNVPILSWLPLDILMSPFSPRTMPVTLELRLLLLALALRGEAVSPATSTPEPPSETCGAALADVLRRLRELEGHVQALRGHCGDTGGPQAGTGNTGKPQAGTGEHKVIGRVTGGVIWGDHWGGWWRSLGESFGGSLGKLLGDHWGVGGMVIGDILGGSLGWSLEGSLGWSLGW